MVYLLYVFVCLIFYHQTLCKNVLASSKKLDYLGDANI